MTAALLKPELKHKVGDAEMVCVGKAMEGPRLSGNFTDDVNDVSLAVGRRVGDTHTPENREARDVQLFRRAVAYAYKPAWSEPAGEKMATTLSLFGDGKLWPSDGIEKLKVEFSEGKKFVTAAGQASINELLTFLEDFHKIKNMPGMSQKEAERLHSRLQPLMLKYNVGEQFGSLTLLYRWDVASLKKLNPQQRAAALSTLLEPARVEVQRQIVTKVNVERAAIANKKTSEELSRKRLKKRADDGERVNVSQANEAVAKYQALKAAEAAKAANKEGAADATEPPKSPASDSQ